LPALVLLRKPLFGLAKRQLFRTLGDSFLRDKRIQNNKKDWFNLYAEEYRQAIEFYSARR